MLTTSTGADRKPLDPPPVLHFELDNMDENSEADKTLMSGMSAYKT